MRRPRSRAVAAAALLAPWIAPHDPSAQDLRSTFASPSLEHPAGTDNLGRDWASRLLYGARLSLVVGVVSQAIVLGIGLPLGLLAGAKGRWVDSVIMRCADLVYAFPDLLLIILLRSALGGSAFMLVVIIGLVTWVDVARLVRGQALSLKEREFVTAARVLGATDREIMTRHLLPNLAGPLVVVVAFGIPRAVFIEAALSFIGFGVDPSTPSWGVMVQEGYGAIVAFPHLVIFPSAAIGLLLLAFTFLGDGLRDALDPSIEDRAAPSIQAETALGGRRERPSEELPKAA
ncbi:MAG TPA: ABC transporter permease [Dehalococcoidia bacterium]|nr:ABC transporter permease [Dehalococcoidia bacterium]